MSYKESDIVYERGRAWVLKDRKQPHPTYVVFVTGVTHSTCDSAYPLDEDGLSLAKARANYLGDH